MLKNYSADEIAAAVKEAETKRKEGFKMRYLINGEEVKEEYFYSQLEENIEGYYLKEDTTNYEEIAEKINELLKSLLN